MNITILNGSPRKNGFSSWTATLLKSHIHSRHPSFPVQILQTSDFPVSTCDGCGFCNKGQGCKYKDSHGDFIEILKQTELFLCISPVYFSGVPSSLKCIIDRCQWIWEEKYTHKRNPFSLDSARQGFLILFGGAPFERNQFRGTEDTLHMFFRVLNISHIDTIGIWDTDLKKPSDLSLENDFAKILDWITIQSLHDKYVSLP